VPSCPSAVVASDRRPNWEEGRPVHIKLSQFQFEVASDHSCIALCLGSAPVRPRLTEMPTIVGVAVGPELNRSRGEEDLTYPGFLGKKFPKK